MALPGMSDVEGGINHVSELFLTFIANIVRNEFGAWPYMSHGVML